MTDPIAPLPPVVGGADAWSPVTATYTCDRCGEVACTVTLVPPFARDPNIGPPGTPGEPPGLDRMFPEAVRLAIDGPTKVSHSFMPEMDVDVSSIEAAVSSGEASRLYAINTEFAPSWCWRCRKNYCKDCWVVWVEYDEGFYDCTRGRCPVGHERILDD